MIKFGNITIGADPELFLMNPNDGGFVSAHIVKDELGTKDEPLKVPCGAVQLDGVAAEFNIDPAFSANDFCTYIRIVRHELQKKVRDTGYVLVPEPVADFEPTYWDTQVPPEQKVLGCIPDYNAWELCPNDTPVGDRPFRTGAGHIHVGWGHDFDVGDPDHFELAARVARQLDYYLGIWSLSWDRDNRRRELYGKAGCFRPKPYGMEYRVLSNKWLSSEILQRWVFNSTIRAMRDLEQGICQEDFYKDKARHIINDNELDWFKAPGAIKLQGVPMPPAQKAA